MLRLSINFNLCISILTVMTAAMGIMTVIGFDTGVSLLLAVSFLLIAGYAVLHICKNRASLEVTVLVALSIFNVLFNGLVEDAALNFGYFKKLIMFVTFVLVLNYGVRYGQNVSEKVKNIIKKLPLLTAAVMLLSYFIFHNTERYADGITIGFDNPNLTAAWLLHLILFGFLYISEFRRTSWARLLFIPVELLLVYLLMETRARSGMIGLAAFLALILLYPLRFRLNRFWLFAIGIFPLLFMGIYMVIVDADWFSDLFDFAVSAGKGLDSRFYIWREGLTAWRQHLLTGNYAGISKGTGMSQMHNSHLDVFCSYGLIAGFLFLKNLCRNMQTAGEACTSFYRYCAMSAFCAVIVMGTFEAVLVTGSLGANYMTVGFLILAMTGDTVSRQPDGLQEETA